MWPSLRAPLVLLVALGAYLWHRAPLLCIDAYHGPPSAIGFVGDEVVVRYADDIEAWTVRNGVRRAWPRVPAPSGLAVSPQGGLVVAGDAVVTLPGGGVAHHLLIEAAACSPDGAEIVGRVNGRWFLVRPDGSVSRALESAPHEPWERVGPAAFSLDGRRVAGLAADGVRIWDRATGARIATIPWLESPHAIGLSPEGSRVVLVGSGPPGDGMPCALVVEGPAVDGATPTSTVQVQVTASSGGRSLLFAAAVAADASLVATGSFNGEVDVFDTTGRRLGSFTDHLSGLTALAFSPDGRLLASGAGDDLLCVRRVPR